MLEHAISPDGNLKPHAACEVAWTGEEMERIRIRAHNDPCGTADCATTLPAGNNRRFAIETASLSWLATDPAAAGSAEGLPDETERTQALTHIASEAVRDDPHLALELACSLPEPAMEEIVPRAAAADWVGQFPDGVLLDTALSHLPQAPAE